MEKITKKESKRRSKILKLSKPFFENKGKTLSIENGEKLLMEDDNFSIDVYVLTENGILPVCYMPKAGRFPNKFRFSSTMGRFIEDTEKGYLLSNNYITKKQLSELSNLLKN